MDSTTKMLVDQIIKQGWYRKSQTLGEGGWRNIPDWNKYVFFTETGGIEDTVFAKSDEIAEKAFHEIYNFEEIKEDWDIYEIVTEYRLIQTNDKGE